jgi:histone-lysine N-methyltransferase SETMAR
MLTASNTNAFFCTKIVQKVHKYRLNLLWDWPLILHDNARPPHLGKVVTDLLRKYEWEVLPHAPYSSDMSPSDFDLFHKLKEPMRGHRFTSLEEVSAAVTRAIRGQNKSGTLTGTGNLPKRWDAVIEKQGEYIPAVLISP